MSVQILLRKKSAIVKIAHLLRAGQIVAAPTETAYGLLAKATSVRAVRRVVKIKGREPGKPIALVAADIKMVRHYFRMSKVEQRLAEKFWPGPLTILLKPKKKFPHYVVGQAGLVGVRVPGAQWLRQLITAVKVPLTATSANRSGEAASYTSAAVKKNLAARGLKFLVDGGSLKRRPTSTVIRVRRGNAQIIRRGAVDIFKLKRVINLNI
jgi:L-threonylcarbamoyladenylate synthase